MVKKRYRDEILALRRAQWMSDPESKAKKDQFIKTNLLNLTLWHDAGTILFYVSRDDEADTISLIKTALQSGKRVIVPRVCATGSRRGWAGSSVRGAGGRRDAGDRPRAGGRGAGKGLKKAKKRHLDLCEIKDLSQLEEGAFGILEPKSACPMVHQSEISLAIVPGIAFDQRGHRVGYGKGYFDRLLKKLDCPRVGLAYEFQIVEYIPEEDFDVPCDLVVVSSGAEISNLEKNQLRS